MARQREQQFERHMSDSEALMWNLEKDPALSSWFASLTLLDRPPSMERFRARIANAAVEVPRLRQRVVASVGRLSPPVWVDDPDFDLDHHIWRIAVPAPGTDTELHELAVRLLVEPFERTRPLWQFVIIEGLADGRAALFQKMHHTITDGEGGVRLAERFVDLEREPNEPDPAELPVPEAEVEGFGDAAREVIGHNVRRVGGLAQRVARSVVLDPLGTARGLGLAARELDRSLRPSHDQGTSVGSPLWQPRTLKRWFGTLRVPLDDVKRAGKSLGGTVNDVFVAGALAGATAYHVERGVTLDRMRVAMPVSTRRGGTVGGNSFAITTTDVDALADPVEALGAVHDALAATKEGGSVDLVGQLAMVVNLLPTSVLTSFAKDAAATVDFTVSNVRGAPIELYIAGARCEGLFPLGPISGTAFNLTTMSYAGNLDMGLVVDAGAVEDPRGLRDHLVAAYDELLAATR
ncbi:MAG TPA: wax ester/triacylglycerol synthase domain-containing protein [Acidimicrobiales bacterium]|nr:wax ester/triacylglycerol synthase domain-containing protein [Acidimicrobiales bacterium]